MDTLTAHTHSHASQPAAHHSFELFGFLRRWIDHIEVKRSFFAHLICHLIPSGCPFERDVQFWGRTIHIPALCHLNPVYDELVALRFRALVYLGDICHEDITPYLG